LKPGEIDWDDIFAKNGARWFHTGGIFAGLSDSTAEVALEAMKAAKSHGVTVSYDLNYRDSLWSDRGGREAANDVNRSLLEFADVVFGVEDFNAYLSKYARDVFQKAASEMLSRYTNLQIVATTLRDIRSASRHDVGGVCFADGE